MSTINNKKFIENYWFFKEKMPKAVFKKHIANALIDDMEDSEDTTFYDKFKSTDNWMDIDEDMYVAFLKMDKRLFEQIYCDGNTFQYVLKITKNNLNFCRNCCEDYETSTFQSNETCSTCEYDYTTQLLSPYTLCNDVLENIVLNEKFWCNNCLIKPLFNIIVCPFSCFVCEAIDEYGHDYVDKKMNKNVYKVNVDYLC
ncbi:hypothetical protein [Urbanus proteus nucleopolyhedrovirus]|uniref:Uncharacterized protein n=1 Tax=Urbanus proteus nucleopolyhedrovirus TaxID=1675866 RepID=A0A162GTZ2_9ABAC|nr:hypothetical protein [Urbanus proteus nucleopolyhedrovirus]AKR17306.1 hypothetical protein [Urbanus proteus nucleopolyhedrovirus]